MKKVISLLLVAGMLVCALCSCGGSSETESQIESDDRQTASIQSEAKIQSQVQTESVTPEPTYYHAAIKGAVIVNQDGSPSFRWSKKCEVCGKVESNTNTYYGTGGTYHGSFSCTACHETQQYEIETTKND